MDKTTKQVTGGMAAVIIALGATLMLGTDETIQVGESRIVNQGINHEIVVTKTSEGNKEIKVYKRKFDKNTGGEIYPEVYVYNTDSINEDILAKLEDIIRVQKKVLEWNGYIQGATGDTITLTIPQFNADTGEEIDPIINELLIEDIKNQIKAGNEAIDALNLQIEELQNLINESNKIN